MRERKVKKRRERERERLRRQGICRRRENLRNERAEEKLKLTNLNTGEKLYSSSSNTR